jgi:hypothetical protein
MPSGILSGDMEFVGSQTETGTELRASAGFPTGYVPQDNSEGGATIPRLQSRIDCDGQVAGVAMADKLSVAPPTRISGSLVSLGFTSLYRDIEFCPSNSHSTVGNFVRPMESACSVAGFSACRVFVTLAVS